MADTGIVFKNDVHVHGSSVTRDGIVIRKKCACCRKEIGDLETVYYVFRARGTASATACYVHIDCEKNYRFPPETNKRTWCRICGKNEDLDGRMPPGLFYHSACLPNAKKETLPEEEIKRKLVKRTEGRFKRARLYYDIPIMPYEGVKLHHTPRQWHRDDSAVRVEARLLDGKIVQASFRRVYIFTSGHWNSVEEIKRQAVQDCFTRQPLTSKEIDALLQVYRDLQQHYDKRGRPIGERMDADFKLRFLLEHGTTVEGIINEAREKE